MVSYITLWWRRLYVLVSTCIQLVSARIQLHIAPIHIFSYIQLLGTFCIDRRRPFMIKKSTNPFYVIRLRSLHAVDENIMF